MLSAALYERENW